MNRYRQAMTRQGFTEPFDESPITTPDGWCHGSVQQTGGMVMVRIWNTEEKMGLVSDECPGKQVEYEVAYGDAPGVSIQEYHWKDDYYEFNRVLKSVPVTENTDEEKSKVAKKLMEEHNEIKQEIQDLIEEHYDL